MPELFCEIRLFFGRRTSFDYHSKHEQHLAAVFLVEKTNLLHCIRSFRTIISRLILVRREGRAMNNNCQREGKGRKLGGGGAGRKII